MKKSKILTLMIAFVMVSTLALTVNAETVETTEFGTFSYWVPSGVSSVTGYTAISKNTFDNTIYITMEMQNAANGQVVAEGSNSSTVEGCVDRSLIKPAGVDKTITYSCHEARGVGSIARYKATTL